MCMLKAANTLNPINTAASWFFLGVCCRNVYRFNHEAVKRVFHPSEGRRSREKSTGESSR